MQFINFIGFHIHGYFGENGFVNHVINISFYLLVAKFLLIPIVQSLSNFINDLGFPYFYYMFFVLLLSWSAITEGVFHWVDLNKNKRAQPIRLSDY